MRKALSTVFVIAAMLIAFLGQTMAFGSVISTEKHNEQSYLSSLGTQISINDDISGLVKEHKKNITNCAEIDCCSTDCCDVECVCAGTGCSSLMFLNNIMTANQLAIFNETISLPKTKQANSITSLPYRPPILIS